MQLSNATTRRRDDAAQSQDFRTRKTAYRRRRPSPIAPPLILVGGLMMAPLVDIAWDDAEVAIPAFLTVALIPLTFSIANGLAFGIMAYALLKLVRGKVTRTDWLLLVISALFVARFVWLSAVSGG